MDRAELVRKLQEMELTVLGVWELTDGVLVVQHGERNFSIAIDSERFEFETLLLERIFYLKVNDRLALATSLFFQNLAEISQEARGIVNHEDLDNTDPIDWYDQPIAIEY